MQTGRKVLILDDNLMDVMQTESHLEQAGYRVVHLSSPHGVLSKIEFEAPDILVLDVGMPRVDVPDVVASLRRSTEFADLVIVAYSNREADELHRFCVEHDLNGYYCKSMDAAQFPAFLENFYEA